MASLPPPSQAIGIDLGTTYSCVAFCKNGTASIIKNNLGVTTTPSQVAFLDPAQSTSTSNGPFIVGDVAKKQADINPKNIIYDVKRIIGRRFNDPVLQQDIKRWPFNVVDVDNVPRIEVNGCNYHPEQISAKILVSLKKQAEAHLGHPVTNAVITVPAYFNDGQRQATRDAGAIAGLNVLTIINEPTAAAIAYNHQLKQQSETGVLAPKIVLVFDLGGGTFDLAIMKMDGENIDILAVDGHSRLGGQDFDNNMVDYCLKEFEKKHHVDLSKCSPTDGFTSKEKFDVGKRLRRLKNECEAKKINLSSTKQTPVALDCIYGEIDLSVNFRRATFERINQHLFDQCIVLIDRILTDANMTKEQIDDVVLVGGSTRIPKIQEMIKNHFGGRPPMQNIKHEEAVAYGAAVKATQLVLEGQGQPVQRGERDVLTHSIGVQLHVDAGNTNDYSIILKKNTKVPCQGKNTYFTVIAGQHSALITILQGERPSAKDNDWLGEFLISNLPPDGAAAEPVDVYMEVNAEGILHATAKCPKNKAKSDIVVLAMKGRLSQEDLETFRIKELEDPTL